jgi:hypothetical protein
MSDTQPNVIPVTVKVWIEDGAVKFSSNPEPVPIDKGNCDVLITFTLDGTGFSFSPTDAILPNKKSKNDFPCPSWTISDTLAALYDRNKNAAKVKYTVNVVDAEGNPHSYDPEIQNGGGMGTCDDEGGDDDC